MEMRQGKPTHEELTRKWDDLNDLQDRHMQESGTMSLELVEKMSEAFRNEILGDNVYPRPKLNLLQRIKAVWNNDPLF